MTVQTTKSSSTFEGNGVTTVFPCDWKIFAATDIVVSFIVVATGVSTDAVNNTDYVVSGADADTGFTVTTTVPVPVGTNMFVDRNLPYTQPTSIQNQGAFFPSVHEDAFDRTEMQVQQLAEEMGRALTMPGGLTPPPSMTLPWPQLGSLFGWNQLVDGTWYIANAGGSGVGAGSIVDGNIAGSAAINPTKIAYTAPGSSLVRNAYAKLSESISVMDFGAVGDGVTDDTVAFQAACDYAHSVGYDVTIPNKRFLLNPIIVKGSVCLRGTTPGPFDSVNADGTIPVISAVPKGPTLLVGTPGSTVPFIQLDGYGSGIKNVIIYYPTQVAPSASTPNVYPYAIVAGATGTGVGGFALTSGPGHFIEGVTLVNAYNGISLQSGRSAIRNCMIGAFNVGIRLDGVADYVWLSGIIHQVLWNTWANVSTPQPIDQWVMDHSIAFLIGRCDGFLMSNIGIFMRNTGISMHDSALVSLPNPTGAYGYVSNMDMDTVVTGVLATTSNGLSTKFSNVEIAGASMTGTVTATGNSAMIAQTGGNFSPNLRWIGGGANGTWTNPAGPIGINTGSIQCRNVAGVNETGPAANTPAMPGSGSAYTVLGATPYMVAISGGTVSQIAINSLNTGLTQGVFHVSPGDTIKITYTATPAWHWFVR